MIRSALIPLLLIAPLALAADSKPEPIVGEWVTEGGQSRVRVTEVNGRYYGMIVWLKEPVYEPGHELEGQPKRDRRNPDPSKHRRYIMGLQVLRDFQKAGQHTYKGGRVYDPESGRTYRGKITFQPPNKLHMRGFVGVSLFGRTSIWTRYVPPEEPHTLKQNHE